LHVMKQVFILSGLALSLAAARADLVMQQNIEGAMMNGTVTTQMKGNQVRVDIPSTPQGPVSTIMDLSSGDQVMLVHQQKVAMKVPGAMVREMVENMRKARAKAGTNAPNPQFTDTGKTEKVGDYTTEVYNWSSTNGMHQTVWVAKNFPNFARIKIQMDKLNNSPFAQVTKGSAPDVGQLPGLVVKSEMDKDGQKVTSTLVSVKEQSLDASTFETPQGYQLIIQPDAGPPPNQ